VASPLENHRYRRSQGWRRRGRRWPRWLALSECSTAGSIWYPITFLAVTVYAHRLSSARPTEFVPFGQLCDCLVLHGVGSIFVGLLYGAMLPMIRGGPSTRRANCPGVVSGLLYSTIELSILSCQPHQLVLVYRVTNRFRSCGRYRRVAAAPCLDSRKSAVRPARRIEAPGTVSQRKSEEKRREAHFRHLCSFATSLRFSLQDAARPHGQPRSDSRFWRRTSLGFGLLSRRTAPAVTCGRREGPRSRSPILFILLSRMMLRSANVSHKAFPAPRCRLSPKAPADVDGRADRLTDQGNSFALESNGILDAASAPPYTRKLIGDAQRGEPHTRLFANLATVRSSAVDERPRHLDDSFLALSDQSLRTIVITGRLNWERRLAREFDWQADVGSGNHDVIAWLASRRVPNPGQPYSAFNNSHFQESGSANGNIFPAWTAHEMGILFNGLTLLPSQSSTGFRILVRSDSDGEAPAR